jgi:ABC-type uncharacterized transport system permease subunit
MMFQYLMEGLQGAGRGGLLGGIGGWLLCVLVPAWNSDRRYLTLPLDVALGKAAGTLVGALVGLVFVWWRERRSYESLPR